MAEKIEHSYAASLVVTKTITTTIDDEFLSNKMSQRSNQLTSLEVKGKDIQEILNKIKCLLNIEVEYADEDVEETTKRNPF